MLQTPASPEQKWAKQATEAHQTLVSKHQAEIKEILDSVRDGLGDSTTDVETIVKAAYRLNSLVPNSPIMLSKCLALLLPFPTRAGEAMAALTRQLDTVAPNHKSQAGEFAKAVLAAHHGHHHLALQWALSALQLNSTAEEAALDARIPELVMGEFLVGQYLSLGARLSAIEFWSTRVIADDTFLEEANLAATAAMHLELFYNTAWSPEARAQADEKLLTYLELYQDPELWIFAATVAFENSDFEQCLQIYQMKNLDSLDKSLSSYKPSRKDMLVFPAALIELGHEQEAFGLMDQIVARHPREFLLHLWRLRLALHVNKDGVGAWKIFLDSTKDLLVVGSEAWELAALRMLASSALLASPDVTPEYKLELQAYRERLVDFGLPRAYYSTLDESFDKSIRLGLVSKEQSGSSQDLDLVALDRKMLRNHALHKIQPLSKEEVASIGTLETALCKALQNVPAAQINAKAALTLSRGLNHQAAKDLLELSPTDPSLDQIEPISPRRMLLLATSSNNSVQRRLDLYIEAIGEWSKGQGVFRAEISAALADALQLALLQPNETPLLDLSSKICALGEGIGLRRELFRWAELPSTTPQQKSLIRKVVTIIKALQASPKDLPLVEAREKAIFGEEVNWYALIVQYQASKDEEEVVELFDLLMSHAKLVDQAFALLASQTSPRLGQLASIAKALPAVLQLSKATAVMPTTTPLGEEPLALLHFLESATSTSQEGLFAQMDKDLTSEGPQSLPPHGGPTIEAVTSKWRKAAVSALRAYKAALQILPPSVLLRVVQLMGERRGANLEEAFGTEGLAKIKTGQVLRDLQQLDQCLLQHLQHLS